jgi:dTDP-4-amino-4,6-dideoxygalactose transaminase
MMNPAATEAHRAAPSTQGPIPFNDLRAAYLAQRDELDAAAQRVLQSGWYILGQEVAAFEDEFAAWCGAAGCVGVNSGTDALLLALRSMGIGPGDEVITVAHTAVATVAAIVMAGAVPVLVDIDPLTFTMDPGEVVAAMTPRTRALIPVHLYGHPADMQPLLALAVDHDLRVIEDCAQAHGAAYFGHPVGTLGDLACFSFYPTKNLGALGDGGAVVSRDAALLEPVRLQREYGWAPQERYVSQVTGINSRLDELQAALLRVKLTQLDAANERRRHLAAHYAACLPPGLLAPTERRDHRHVYHLYVVQAASRSERDRLRAGLADRGIGAAIHYPVPVHRQPGYANQVVTPRGLPVTEAVAERVLSLPMYPSLSEADVERVCAALRDLLA